MILCLLYFIGPEVLMEKCLDKLIDQKLNGALTQMAKDDARTPALQLLWLARVEAIRRGLLPVNVIPNKRDAAQQTGVVQSAIAR
ncbi:MAG: hypothetical protein HY257_04660 [Chloroflexi bacterium]|nr:hypothetical protein [Chloroflexota bacterium]